MRFFLCPFPTDKFFYHLRKRRIFPIPSFIINIFLPFGAFFSLFCTSLFIFSQILSYFNGNPAIFFVLFSGFFFVSFRKIFSQSTNYLLHKISRQNFATKYMNRTPDFAKKTAGTGSSVSTVFLTFLKWTEYLDSYRNFPCRELPAYFSKCSATFCR